MKNFPQQSVTIRMGRHVDDFPDPDWLRPYLTVSFAADRTDVDGFDDEPSPVELRIEQRAWARVMRRVARNRLPQLVVM